MIILYDSYLHAEVELYVSGPRMSSPKQEENLSYAATPVTPARVSVLPPAAQVPKDLRWRLEWLDWLVVSVVRRVKSGDSVTRGEFDSCWPGEMPVAAARRGKRRTKYGRIRERRVILGEHLEMGCSQCFVSASRRKRYKRRSYLPAVQSPIILSHVSW